MTTDPLEPGPEGMQELGQAALDWVTTFVEGLARAPSDARSSAAPSTAAQNTLRAALLAEPPEDPSEFGELLTMFGAAAGPDIETSGSTYLGYVPGGGLYVFALAEFLD